MTNKKDLRNNLIGKKASFKSTIVTVDGSDYEVKQLSLRDRNEIIRRSYNVETQEHDFLSASIWNIIFSVYVPGTDEKVFEPSDFDTLANQPATGGFVDKFIEASGSISGENEGKADTPDSSETTT